MEQDKPDKIFEEWTPRNCNECARYWDSSCDGVKRGQKRTCNAFFATRNVVIPQQIEKLQNDLKSLKITVWLLSIFTLIQSVLNILNYIG